VGLGVHAVAPYTGGGTQVGVFRRRAAGASLRNDVREEFAMFTLEIDGVAIAVINGSEEVARDLFTCDGFKDDIQAMKSEGKVLWNGTSPLKIRPATEEETEIFEDALAEDDSEEDEPFEPDARHAEAASNDDDADEDDADEDDEEEGEDEADIVFLVDIDEDSGLDS